VRWRARTNVQQQCPLRARRPQLKRDPLGRPDQSPRHPPSDTFAAVAPSAVRGLRTARLGPAVAYKGRAPGLYEHRHLPWPLRFGHWGTWVRQPDDSRTRQVLATRLSARAVRGRCNSGVRGRRPPGWRPYVPWHRICGVQARVAGAVTRYQPGHRGRGGRSCVCVQDCPTDISFFGVDIPPPGSTVR